MRRKIVYLFMFFLLLLLVDYSEMMARAAEVSATAEQDKLHGSLGAVMQTSESCVIAGWISNSDIGLPGVTLTFADKGSTTTDSNGYYFYFLDYNWSGTVTPSKEGYTFIPSSRTYSKLTKWMGDENYKALSIIPTMISLDPTDLFFEASTDGIKTISQIVSISNSGGGFLKWNVKTVPVDHWLKCERNSGIAPSVIRVGVIPDGLTPGIYNSFISITSTTAYNSPQFLNVTLSVYDAGSNLHWGDITTPINGSTVTGSIAISGWVHDNIVVEKVGIYRGSIAGESGDLIYIGDAVFIEGVRPDIEFPSTDYSNDPKTGWGYVLLTNALPNQGNGTFTLFAKAVGKKGKVIDLGSKTITCDNAHAVNPFGALDTPPQGGMVSGNNYINFGWALTPQPKAIDPSGSSITVWVDGVALGNPVYNKYRQDIAALFPGYNNSGGAGGNYMLDTTTYQNGVHTISWSVKDNAGNTDAIGIRYFTIQNTGSGAGSASIATQSQANQGTFMAGGSIVDPDFSQIPLEYTLPIRIKKGYDRDLPPEIRLPEDDGIITIEIKELERVEVNLAGPVDSSEIDLSPEKQAPQGNLFPRYFGYLVQGDELRPLPIGSTLEAVKGIFYWQPGPGFIGAYELVFIRKSEAGEMSKRQVIITINPGS